MHVTVQWVYFWEETFVWIHFCGDSQNQPVMTFFLTLHHPRTSHVTLNCSHVRKHLMVFFPNFERTDSVLPKPVGSLLTATPVATIKVANKDETGRRLYVQGNESNADLHFTPKGKVQIEKQARNMDCTVSLSDLLNASCWSLSQLRHILGHACGRGKLGYHKSAKQLVKAFSCKVSLLYGVFL